MAVDAHVADMQARWKRANEAFAKDSRLKPSTDDVQAANKWGLDNAYASPDGVFKQGDTMYIAGTRLPSPSDIVDDLMIPLGLTSHGHRYADAEKQLNPQIKRVVGHSLGGSVALELAKNHNLRSEVYGTPALSFEPSATRHRHDWDLVSIFDRGASSTPSPGWNPHSY